MIKKLLVIVAVPSAVGILVYSYFGAIPLPSILQSAFTKTQAVWATIPEPIKGILQVVSIPSIISGVFFAWTKIRAMNQLQETKLEASQQITQVEGKLTEAQTVIENQKEQITTMAGDGVTGLTTKLSEAQTTIGQKEEEIKRLTTRVNEAEHLANVIMHPTEADLKKRLQQAGYTITRTVR